VVGLGNPEPQYFDTRHNLGWRLVDRMCERCGLALTGTRRH